MTKNKEQKESDPFQRAGDFLEGSTQIVRRTAGLVGALTILAVETAAFAGVFMTVSQLPAGKKLPSQCTAQILSVSTLPPVQAADEIFWKHHPELKRRHIRSYETEFSKEWNKDLDQTEFCRNLQK